jgi:hypothetical protein
MLKQGQLKQDLMKKRNQALHVKKTGSSNQTQRQAEENDGQEEEEVTKETMPYLANQFWKVGLQHNIEDLLSDYE